MKRFLKNFTIGVFILGILAFPIDILLSRLITNTHDPTGEAEVLKDIHQGISTDVAIYGSSRAAEHFDSKLLESKLEKEVYNFGIKGNRFIMQNLRHRLYYDNAIKKPELILLSLDIFSLKALSKNDGIYNKERLLPYMLWNDKIKKFAELYSPNTFDNLDYYIPLYRYHGNNAAFLSLYTLFNQNIRYKGFVGKNELWKKIDLQKAKEKFSNYKLDSMAKFQLEEFVKHISNSKTKLIMVYSPEHIIGQQIVSNRDEIISYYKSIASKNNIEFLDYSNLEMCKDTTYFHNSSHLNLKGVKKFNEILVHDLKALGY